MLPFDLTWLESLPRRSFRERFDSTRRFICSALVSLSKSRIISINWLAPNRARLFLANGTFVALDFHDNINTLEDVSPFGLISGAATDPFMMSQLDMNFHEATDALLSNDFAVVVSGTTYQQHLSATSASNQNSLEFSDHNLYFVYFGRRHVGSGCEQLSQLDPHVQILPLGSSTLPNTVPSQFMGRREKKLSDLVVKPTKSDFLRLIMNSAKDLFAVWWASSNSSEVANAEISESDDEDGLQSKGIRPGGVLLFRLNAAVCVLNPLAALQPAGLQHILLVSFSNTAACEMFVVEWSRKEQHKMSYLVVTITTYLIDHEELVRLDSSPLTLPDRSRSFVPAMAALSPQDDRLLVAMQSGHLFLVNVRTSVIASSSSRFSAGIVSIAWHPSGSMFSIVDVTGKLSFLDLGLSVLRLFQLRKSQEAIVTSTSLVKPYIPLGDFDIFISKSSASLPLLSWNPDESRSSNIDKLSSGLGQTASHAKNPGFLLISWAGLHGIGALRLVLPRAPTPSYLIRHWLSLARSLPPPSVNSVKKKTKKQADEALAAAVAIVSAMDFDTDGEQAVRCVSMTATALLRQRPMDALIDSLLEKCLSSFCNPLAPISEVTKLEFGPAISQILRRRALHLLRHGKLETAFDVAANQLPTPATDLLADTFYAALERGELALAKAAYARARRQVASATSNVEIPGLNSHENSDTQDEEEEHYQF